MVLQLLAESVREPRKPPHPHSHRKILPLNKTGGDVLGIGLPGVASVGRALGQMINNFHRPSLVFLDGDQTPSTGCILLPGGDAPERVAFDGLVEKNWASVAERISRPPSDVIDCCTNAMTMANHHDWVRSAADRLVVGGNVLWQALCAEWSKQCLKERDAKAITDTVKTMLGGHPLPVGKYQEQFRLAGT